MTRTLGVGFVRASLCVAVVSLSAMSIRPMGGGDSRDGAETSVGASLRAARAEIPVSGEGSAEETGPAALLAARTTPRFVELASSFSFPPPTRTEWEADPAAAAARPQSQPPGPEGRGSGQPASSPRDPARWEEVIRKFEEEDRLNPPEPGGIVFVGSSSIRGWDLEKSFPGLPVVNRGFGGSLLTDCAYYVDRIVAPRKPSVVVLYAGDNDIAVGHSPRQVFSDYKAFVNKVRDKLPETRIIFIGIKPSPSRWEQFPSMRHVNFLVWRCCSRDEKLTFVSVERAMLNERGRPRYELFKSDGLHLNEKGYEVWTARLRPYLAPTTLPPATLPGAPPAIATTPRPRGRNSDSDSDSEPETGSGSGSTPSATADPKTPAPAPAAGDRP